MISLKTASPNQLTAFDTLDRQAHASRFLISTGLTTHRCQYVDPNITYLSIENTNGSCCGYFILVKNEEDSSVEFRRIVIDQNHRGIGQLALQEMERYCWHTLRATRIWLDVFEDNAIGMHIYEKMGYVRFNATTIEGRQLFFYEKVHIDT